MKLIYTIFLSLFYFKALPQQNFSKKIDSLNLLLRKPHKPIDNAKILDELQYYWQFKNLNKSLEIGNKAIIYAKQSGNKEQIATVISNLAFSYMLAGDAFKSIKLLFELIETDKRFSTMAWAFIAMNYRNQGDYTAALKYAKMSANAGKDYRLVNDDRSQFGDPINAADLFEKLNELDSAYHYSKIAYHMVQNKVMPVGGESFAWEARHLYGRVLLRKKQFNKSYTVLKEAVKYAKEIDDDLGYQKIYLSLAEYFQQIQQADSAINYAEKSFEISKTNGNLYISADAGFLLSQLFEKQQDYKKAILYNRLATTAKDSIINVRNSFKFQNLTLAEEKKREVLLANEKEAKAQANKNLLYLGLFFLSLLSFIFYKNKRKTDLLNKKLNAQNIEIENFNKNLEQKVIERTTELENALNEVKAAFDKGQTTERKRVSADLHDEIGSALSTIAIFSDISKLKATKIAPDLVNDLNKIGVKSREMIQNMKDTIWSLNEENSISLTEKMWQHASETLKTKNIKLKWQLSDNEIFIGITNNQKRNLFMAFKEAINNIIKHSEATFVSISFQKTTENTILIIADNGVGFETSKNMSKGNRLRNFENRMLEIGGVVNIESNVNNGTKLSFTIPHA